jgi:hypothetical protein
LKLILTVSFDFRLIIGHLIFKFDQVLVLLINIKCSTESSADIVLSVEAAKFYRVRMRRAFRSPLKSRPICDIFKLFHGTNVGLANYLSECIRKVLCEFKAILAFLVFDVGICVVLDQLLYDVLHLVCGFRFAYLDRLVEGRVAGV